MTDLPQFPGMTPEQAFERLQQWYQKKAQLNALKQNEHLERVALSEFYFPQAQEGTNRLALGGGYDLKLQHGYNYRVTEEDLDNVAAADIKRLKLPWDELFVYKPELSIKTYRQLTAEQKKFVDAILDIKPASPQLEIVPGANREGQAAHAAAAEAGNVAASDSPVADSCAFVVVLDAEAAEPGQYYSDGETWWVLGEDIEWQEVNVAEHDENGNDIGPQLDAELERLKAEAAAAKPKRGRPRKS